MKNLSESKHTNSHGGARRRKGPTPESVAKAQRLRQLIEQHKGDSDISKRMLAKRVGIEITHFMRVERWLSEQALGKPRIEGAQAKVDSST